MTLISKDVIIIRMYKKYLKLITQSNNSRIFIMSVVVGVILFAASVLESYWSYKSEIRNAEIQAANLSQLLEEQIASSFKKIDIALQELQDDLGTQKRLSAADSATYYKFLITRKNRLPEVLSFKLINSNGEYVGDDIGRLNKQNVRDRDYFNELKNSSLDKLVISKPLISKTAGVWVLVLARGIYSNEGQFRGLVLASISIEHYRKMFAALNVGEHGAIIFYGNDHYVYARKPWREEVIGQRVELGRPMLDLISGAKNIVLYKTISSIDQIERIVAARNMTGYPFVVGTGLALSDALYTWKIRTCLYFVFMIAIFSFFTFFILRFLNSLEILEEQRKQAIQSAKLSSLGEMASGIAHEINNPLTIIAGLAVTLKRTKIDNEYDKKLNDTLDRIIQTVERIAKIIRGLRTFSRDSFDDPVIPTSVQTIIANTLDLAKERILNSNISLKVLPFNDVFVLGREVQIAQVLMNLLNNSLDALEGIHNKWIQIEVIDKGDSVSIRVLDSGPKISAEFAEKIMQPFFTTKAVGKGTGLGLSISKGIVEAHKGKFYLDTEAEFTCFTIELPKGQK